MTKLAEQILARFERQDVVARSDLDLSANYDSIGRALGELVERGKICRVGRGRYRKGFGKRIAPGGSIAEQIERRVGRARKRNVFLRADFDTLGSYDAVGRALRQLTDKGRLVQIGYGLYAKAEESPFTGRPAPVVGINKLATEALARLGKSAQPSSANTAYNRGASTQVPTGRTVAVRDRIVRRIGYDGNYVTFERA